MDLKMLQEKALELLKNLIQFKTINPPGACLDCLEYLKRVCNDEGIATQLHVLNGDRGVVTASIKGQNSELEPMVLLAHIDVVDVNEAGWDVDPFSGVEQDGYIYGRGALDMKCLAAMQLASLIYIKSNNITLDRDVIFVAHGDEESAGEYGAKWYCDKYFDNRKAYVVLNEGVYGFKNKMFKGNLFPIELGHKFDMKVKLTAKLQGGQGSIPTKQYAAKNLVKALTKLTEYKFPIEIKKEISELFKIIAKHKKFPENFILNNLDKKVFVKIFDKIIENDATINAHTRTTIALTKINGANNALGLIPAEASAVLDVRMLPGTDYNEVFAKIRNIVNDNNIHVEIIKHPFISKLSRFDTKAYNILKECIQKEYNDAEVAPYICIGGCDSRYFRNKDIDCYGVIPVLVDDASGRIHCDNERISVENMNRGARVVLDYVLNICT